MSITAHTRAALLCLVSTCSLVLPHADAVAGTQCGTGDFKPIGVGHTIVTQRSCADGFEGTHCVSWTAGSDSAIAMTHAFDISNYGECPAGEPQAGIHRNFGLAADKRISELPASGRYAAARVVKEGNVRRSFSFTVHGLREDGSHYWSYDIMVQYQIMGWTANRGTQLRIPGLSGLWKIRIDTNPLGAKRVSISPDDQNRTYMKIDYARLLNWLRLEKNYISDGIITRIGVSSEASFGGAPNLGYSEWSAVRFDDF